MSKFQSFAVCIMLMGVIENSWEWPMMRSGRPSDLWTFYLLCNTNPLLKNAGGGGQTYIVGD